MTQYTQSQLDEAVRAERGVMDSMTQQAARDARDVFNDYKQACEAVDYMEQLIYTAIRARGETK